MKEKKQSALVKESTILEIILNVVDVRPAVSITHQVFFIYMSNILYEFLLINFVSGMSL